MAPARGWQQALVPTRSQGPTSSLRRLPRLREQSSTAASTAPRVWAARPTEPASTLAKEEGHPEWVGCRAGVGPPALSMCWEVRAVSP